MSIEVRNLSKRLGGKTILDRVSLDIPEGSLVALLGPSGSGKTTLLRVIAGLETPDEGEVLVRGEATTVRRPQDRHVGFVFQHYALFPHMSVRQNVAFGLEVKPRTQRPSRDVIRARVDELLQLIQMDSYGQRLPSELSGGQRQRVALGRALARRPRLLLLDEPFTALDRPAQLRLRRELRELLRGLALPTVLVTHDRDEALHLGDRIVVLDQGRVCQSGDIQRAFDRPTDPAVARILGVETVVRGRVEGVAEGLATVAVGPARIFAADPGGLGQQAFVCIRGEDVAVERQGVAPSGSTARNRLPGTITTLHAEGALVRLSLDCGFPLECLVTRQACQDLGLVEGDAVTAILKAAAVHLIPHD